MPAWRRSTPIARAETRSWPSTPTDGLLAFGRKCLQDSGLISKDSADVGARLSGIDMNRDDKAPLRRHLNAFLDGNRLAYLSLTLAIGVDLLVFMSGLFGAQALRSPLSDVPSPKARSAHQLEAIIEAALLPDIFKNARLTLSALHPREPVDGFTNEVRLYELDPESASQVRDVLNAGATIGAVREMDTRGHYLVRSELHTFLSDVVKRELKRKPEETERGLGLDRLEKRIREALMPECWRLRMRSCSICIRSTKFAASPPRSFSMRSSSSTFARCAIS
jgi:hypothetical protein